MKNWLVVLLALVPVAALAESVFIQHPATRVDGTAIDPVVDIKHFKVLRNGSLYTTVTPAPGGEQVVEVVRQLGTNYVKVVAVDHLNREGLMSNEIVLAANTPTPVPTATPTATPLPLIGAPIIAQP